MYTTPVMKFSKRWRRLAWRSNTAFFVFIGSAALSLTAMRYFVTAAGPKDTYRRRVEAGGSYGTRRNLEVDDNPLYRLPENPASGHRLDGLSQWAGKAKSFEHH